MKNSLIYYLPYIPEKRNYNVKKYATHLWCGAVCCGPDLVGRSVPKSPGPLFGPSPPLVWATASECLCTALVNVDVSPEV